MGTTANQRKLVFDLRKEKSRMSVLDGGDLPPDQVRLIAKRIGVTEQDVVDMNRRLGGDLSLNSPIGEEGESGEGQGGPVEGRASQEAQLPREVEACKTPKTRGEG